MRVLVPTCDRYGHMMPDFARAFVRAWPDCQWPVTIVWAGSDSSAVIRAADDMPEGAGDWRLHTVPDLGWAANLLAYLEMEGSAEPFLLLLDDFILDAVDTMLVNIAAVYIQTVDSVGMVRVHPVPGPTLPINNDIGEIDKALPYAISLQAAIWRPEVIYDLFRSDEDAWQTEIEGSKRAAEYTRYKFLGTMRSAVGYRELMKRGRPIAETQAWIAAHLR